MTRTLADGHPGTGVQGTLHGPTPGVGQDRESHTVSGVTHLYPTCKGEVLDMFLTSFPWCVGFKFLSEVVNLNLRKRFGEGVKDCRGTVGTSSPSLSGWNPWGGRGSQLVPRLP